MKNFFKYAAVLAVILVVGSSAWASSYLDHVKIAPNGQGDLLYFPFYKADASGWSTKLTVTNVSLNFSIVAKVSVRDAKLSQDVLDFMIYLSPADVWTGTLKYNDTLKKVVLNSTDDSVRNAADTAWASSTAPFEYPLESAVQFIDYTRGYIEVIEAIAFQFTAADAPGRSTNTKDVIRAKYLSLAPPAQFVNTPHFTPGLTALTANTLSGKMEVKYATAGISTTLNATALRDFVNTAWMLPGATYTVGVDPSKNTLHEVEAALSKTRVAMPYVNSPTAESTEHIFTFPTKTSDYLGNSQYSNFFSNFAAYPNIKMLFDILSAFPVVAGLIPPEWVHGVSTACGPDSIEYYADIFNLIEGRKYETAVPVSPQPPFVPSYLCYEVNYLSTFDKEKDSKGVESPVFPSSFIEGWVNYGFHKFFQWAPGTLNTPTFTEYFTSGLTKGNDLNIKVSGVEVGELLTYTGAPAIASYLYFDAVTKNLQAGYPSWVDGVITIFNDPNAPINPDIPAPSAILFEGYQYTDNILDLKYILP